MGVVPSVQSKLSRALHVHRGYAKLGKYGNKEIYGKVQGSLGQGRHGIFVESLGISQEDTMKGSLWK